VEGQRAQGEGAAAAALLLLNPVAAAALGVVALGVAVVRVADRSM
jgi:hypothetical protein